MERQRSGDPGRVDMPRQQLTILKAPSKTPSTAPRKSSLAGRDEWHSSEATIAALAAELRIGYRSNIAASHTKRPRPESPHGNEASGPGICRTNRRPPRYSCSRCNRIEADASLFTDM